MRPAADRLQPQKRRRFENGPASPSLSNTQNQPFLNGTIVLPRHPVPVAPRGNSSPYINQPLQRQSLNGQQLHHQIPINQSHGAEAQPHLQRARPISSSHLNGQVSFPNPNLTPPPPFSHAPPTHHHPRNPQNPSTSFATSSVPLQPTPAAPRPQLWASQNPISTSITPNALGNFLSGESNTTIKPTRTGHHQGNQPSFETSGLPSDGNYSAILPPLAPDSATPISSMDPFSNFPPIGTTFANSSPLQAAFLSPNPLTNMSPPSASGAPTSYPLPSPSPAPSMRQTIRPRNQNGMPSHQNQSTNTMQGGVQRFNTASVLPRRPGITPGSNIGTPKRSASLGTISPVKRALDLFRDGTPIMVALAQTVTQTSNVSSTAQRSSILDFTGFSQNLEPKFHWLLSLSKNDLDILAWVFVVSKHGRKEEVGRRIVSSLRAPLKFRIPPPAKKPGIPTRTDARNPSLNTLAETVRNAPKVSHTSSTRSNMPNLVPAPLLNARGEGILCNLQRQLGSSSIRGTTAISPAPNSRSVGQHNRSKQLHSLCSEVLQGFNFDVGENPFNSPLNRPLGSQPYVIFSSMQLSRGNNDPILRFETPAPIHKNERPEVEGGEVQIHIRCLRVEVEKPKDEWKQAWPFPAACRVNGHGVTLSQAQRYTNGKLAGRDAATNITPYLRKHRGKASTDMNKVVLKRQPSTATSAPGQYVFFAQEILVLSHETMMASVFQASGKYWLEYRTNLENKKLIDPTTSKFEMARQGVMQFLTDPDGLTVSSMKVSLRCPLALTRIATPVKGRRCQHVQCFDLENFLEYARRSAKFDCPVCNKNTAYPAMLVISPYIEHALAMFKDCDEVEINQDGSMVEVERKPTGVASDDDEEGDVKTEPRNVSSRSHGGASGAGRASEVVDLTLDSDDEQSLADDQALLTSAVPLVLETSLPRVSASHTQVEEASPGPQGNQGGSSSPTEQDMFSFRADFSWRDTQMAENYGTAPERGQARIDNARDDWVSDVIAIDSD